MRSGSVIGGFLVSLIFGFVPVYTQAIPVGTNFVVVQTGTSTDDIARAAAAIVPSPRQLAWQELEFTAFIHFTVNTYTDREWGSGTEPDSIFNPHALDPRQWAKVCKQAGMKMIIMTAKHHDGFCLWPSQYTEHSVKNSPWRNGEGDVVREVSDACREFGLKFGIYLSPWDRHEATYGNSPVYNRHFENQLTELLTNYGTISEVWFDGANGEGPNGKRQVYDWQAYYRIVRNLQPDAVIAIMGPDVRWVGTESGDGRETEWNVVPDMLSRYDRAFKGSAQDQLDAAFVPRDLMSSDLGSRTKLTGAKSLMWYPAEVDVSIRPGWFYHDSEDSRVKTPGELLDIYYSSVGRNAVLLLNVPPDRRGLIHSNDVQSLKEMRRMLNATFRDDLAAGATVKASNCQIGHEGHSLIDGDPKTCWMADEDSLSATIEFSLSNERTFNVIALQEFISRGQRVESFAIDVRSGGAWKELLRGTTIGYKRLLRTSDVTTSMIRLRITNSRLAPALSSFALYRQPPSVSIEPPGTTFLNSQVVRISSRSKDAKIRYTTDGNDPDVRSQIYSSPLTLRSDMTLNAVAFIDDRTVGLTSSAEFRKARYAVALKTPYSQKYPASGRLSLVDGLQGKADRSDPAWQGYEGNDVAAIVDLGEIRPIQSISSGYLRDINSWIFFPEYVEYSYSKDGKSFSNVMKVMSDTIHFKDQIVTQQFWIDLQDVRGRYVKMKAKNVGICPPWHPGAGGKAWLFVDEISIK